MINRRRKKNERKKKKKKNNKYKESTFRGLCTYKEPIKILILFKLILKKLKKIKGLNERFKESLFQMINY